LPAAPTARPLLLAFGEGDKILDTSGDIWYNDNMREHSFAGIGTVVSVEMVRWDATEPDI
jgi:hypothetical protein